jgi:NADH:ubiquinone oxidoreductase subunit D
MTDADENIPFIVNIGPAHPIVHGILRLLTAVEGETILTVVPEIGYLHRGVEKSIESGNYHQAIPYTDRLNYASPMMNNIGYCKAVEKMLGITIPERDALHRVLFCELGPHHGPPALQRTAPHRPRRSYAILVSCSRFVKIFTISWKKFPGRG